MCLSAKGCFGSVHIFSAERYSVVYPARSSLRVEGVLGRLGFLGMTGFTKSEYGFQV